MVLFTVVTLFEGVTSSFLLHDVNKTPTAKSTAKIDFVFMIFRFLIINLFFVLMTTDFFNSCNLMMQKCDGKMSYATDYVKSNHLEKRNAFEFFCGKVRVLSK